VYSEKFITSPIESRIDKCKMRMVAGLAVLLMGTIEDHCTYENGFPFQIIHLFMHGFHLTGTILSIYEKGDQVQT
jgi:hypothetical protein